MPPLPRVDRLADLAAHQLLSVRIVVPALLPIGGDAVRGRAVPKRAPSGPTVEEMAAAIAGQTGLFMLEYRHDDGCETIKTQRWEDCTCDEVEHSLKRYAPEVRAL